MLLMATLASSQAQPPFLPFVVFLLVILRGRDPDVSFKANSQANTAAVMVLATLRPCSAAVLCSRSATAMNLNP